MRVGVLASPAVRRVVGASLLTTVGTLPVFLLATQSVPLRHDLGFGTADDVAGLITFLASDAAAGISGQAIGAGGDRLQIFSHPQPVTTDYVEGGWTYEQLAEKFDGIAEGHLQKVGEVMPELPEELRPSQG